MLMSMDQPYITLKDKNEIIDIFSRLYQEDSTNDTNKTSLYVGKTVTINNHDLEIKWIQSHIFHC